MGNGYSRLHIKKQLPNGVEINCFGETPAEVIEMVCEAVALAEGDIPEPKPSAKAHTARLSAEHQAAAVSPKPEAAKPVCPNCQSDADVSLISFKLENGNTASRFKCKACNKWVGAKV